jgi:hypothetical protein
MPSATSTSERSSSAGSAVPPNMRSYRVAIESSRSGVSETANIPGTAPPQLGTRSTSSGRAVQITSSGTSRTVAPISSMKRIMRSSAQCRSSKTSTVGPAAASARRNRRQADSGVLSGQRRPGQSDQRPQRVGEPGRLTVRHQVLERGVEAVPGRLRSVGGQHPGLVLDDVGQGGVRDVLPERRAPAAAPAHLDVTELAGVVVELAHQPALADAGPAQDGHQPRLAFPDRVSQGRGEQAEFVVAPDHRQVLGVLLQLPRHRRHREPDLGRRRTPAQRHRRLLDKADLGTGGGVGRAAHEHPAGRRLGLQPGRGVDHVAGDDRLPAVVGGGDVDQRVPGRDPDPVGPLAGAGQRALQVQARPAPPVPRRPRSRPARRTAPWPRRR